MEKGVDRILPLAGVAPHERCLAEDVALDSLQQRRLVSAGLQVQLGVECVYASNGQRPEGRESGRVDGRRRGGQQEAALGNKDKGGRNTKKAPARDLKQKRLEKRAKKNGQGGIGDRLGAETPHRGHAPQPAPGRPLVTQGQSSAR